MKPKYAASQREDTLNQCSDLLRRYNNLEDGIRRDRPAVEQLNARIRQIDIQIANIRAVDRSPKPVIPGIDISKPRGRPSLNPWAWAAEQGAEIVTSLVSQGNARETITELRDELNRLRYERDRHQRLLNDSVAGRSRLLSDMRDLGCPTGGRTNY